MAKKKVTTTVEETEEAPQEMDYQKDLENKSFVEVALDTPDEPVKEEPKEEEKPVEETETIEFDPEQLKKEAVEEGAKLAEERIKASLVGNTPEETKDNKTEYVEWVKDFTNEHGRAPEYPDAFEYLEDKAFERLEAKQAEEAKAKEDEITKAKEVETQNIEATNKYVKDTLDELYTNDKLPKIQDPKDTDDYGQKVQNALLTKVVEVNSQRIKDGMPPKTIKEIFYEDFEAPQKEVPGADAPINMGRGGYTPDETEEVDYRDISGPRNSFRNIIGRFNKKV